MKRLHEGFSLGDRYTLERRLATGGMGDVWQAHDETLQRRVAVKVMRPSTEDEELFAKRFRAEALHTAGLSHVNIATVFDYGEHDGLAFLVMELVAGQTLSGLLADRTPLPTDQVRSVVGQAALALAAAHDAGVVHRDVKPANIMLTADGTVKLTDFGIARAVDGSGHTRTGEVLGTPFYLAPEQALGKPATGASDLYSLGVVAHEMLTGTRPFDAGTPVATALSHVTEEPPPLPEGVPQDLDEIVTQCLHKDPAARPATARVVAAALGFGVQVVPILTESAASEIVGEAVAEELAEQDVPTQPRSSRDTGSQHAAVPAEPPPAIAAVAVLAPNEDGEPTPAAHPGPPEPVSPPAPIPLAAPAAGEQDGAEPAERTMAWSPEWTEPVTRLTDLNAILANLEPRLHEGTYANVAVRQPPEGLQAFMTLVEPEGLTMLVRQDEADARELAYETALAWISLGAYGSITSVGVVAAVTTALTHAGIAAVGGAGHFHTHLLVPAEDAERALKVLVKLSIAHQID